MKTIVTFEVETPGDETVQNFARAVIDARDDLARRGYKVRLSGCRIAPVPAPRRQAPPDDPGEWLDDEPSGGPA